jgi:hypothetical protein
LTRIKKHASVCGVLRREREQANKALPVTDKNKRNQVCLNTSRARRSHRTLGGTTPYNLHYRAHQPYFITNTRINNFELFIKLRVNRRVGQTCILSSIVSDEFDKIVHIRFISLDEIFYLLGTVLKQLTYQMCSSNFKYAGTSRAYIVKSVLPQGSEWRISLLSSANNVSECR